jgi:hypothetical protein
MCLPEGSATPGATCAAAAAAVAEVLENVSALCDIWLVVGRLQRVNSCVPDAALDTAAKASYAACKATADTGVFVQHHIDIHLEMLHMRNEHFMCGRSRQA